MIILAPITLTQGEATTLRQTYRENNQGFDFTGWTGTWTIAQRGATLASGETELQADGDMVSSFTAAQIAALCQDDQWRGRVLPDAAFLISCTDGTDLLRFQAAVRVIRGRVYTSGAVIDTTSLTTETDITLLAE